MTGLLDLSLASSTSEAGCSSSWHSPWKSPLKSSSSSASRSSPTISFGIYAIRNSGSPPASQWPFLRPQTLFTSLCSAVSLASRSSLSMALIWLLRVRWCGNRAGAKPRMNFLAPERYCHSKASATKTRSSGTLTSSPHLISLCSLATLSVDDTAGCV